MDICFAVTIVHSFGSRMSGRLFDSFDKAKEFMTKDYTERLRIDREEKKWDSVGTISFVEGHSGYASIVTPYEVGQDITFWLLGLKLMKG